MAKKQYNRKPDENDGSKSGTDVPFDNSGVGAGGTVNHDRKSSTQPMNGIGAGPNGTIPFDGFVKEAEMFAYHGDGGSGGTASNADGGTLLGGAYKVLEQHAGGMGVVYKCRNLANDRIVALKTVNTDGPMSEDDIRTMQRNFDLVHGLSHDHIIRVNDLKVDKDNGQWYVEMDWVDGESIEWLYSRHGGVMDIVIPETIRILRQVAEALDYAHGRGVYHRDVKNSNIMLERNTGDVKLIDFGIAGCAPRVMPDGRDAHIHDSRTVSAFSGTRGFKSPEQWRGERATAASDEYSLAVTAYRCLSGHLPFWSDNTEKLMEKVLHEAVPSVQSLSKEANAVLAKALSKKAEDRYGSCTEFMDALAKAVRTVGKPSEPKNVFSMTTFYLLAGKADRWFSECGKRQWDRGQTFGRHLDALKESYNAAKAAKDDRDFPTSFDLFCQVESEWQWLELSQPLRESVVGMRKKTTDACRDAMAAEAEQYAASDFQKAKRLENEACGQFEDGQFEDAVSLYEQAEAMFTRMASDSRRARRIQELEQRLADAISQKCFHDARAALHDLQTLDGVDSLKWEEALATAERTEQEAETARRISQLEQRMADAINQKSFQDARNMLQDLTKLDADAAYLWKGKISSAEARWKELEEQIWNTLKKKDFMEARWLANEHFKDVRLFRHEERLVCWAEVIDWAEKKEKIFRKISDFSLLFIMLFIGTFMGWLLMGLCLGIPLKGIVYIWNKMTHKPIAAVRIMPGFLICITVLAAISAISLAWIDVFVLSPDEKIRQKFHLIK